jgi:hypothetical protein
MVKYAYFASFMVFDGHIDIAGSITIRWHQRASAIAKTNRTENNAKMGKTSVPMSR